MAIKNKVMLITYPDSLGKNLKELNEVLHEDLKGAVGGIHLLPFFPSTGDRGFAPTDYTTVIFPMLARMVIWFRFRPWAFSSDST